MALEQVLATNWSGNTAFMNKQNSLPIKVEKLIQRENGEKGHLWAEPSVADLRKKMRWCYENPEEAKKIGEAGRKTMVDQYNPQAVGSIVMKHLNRISDTLERAATTSNVGEL